MSKRAPPLPECVLITGPVKACKTGELITLIDRAIVAEEPFIVAKMYGHRKPGFITSRAPGSKERPEEQAREYPAHEVRMLSELKMVPGFAEARRVFIDELQFFPDAFSVIEEMLSRGVKVYATGLNSTWERRPWNVISEVFALATRVEIRTAICHVCKADATYSMKLRGDKELINFEDKQYDAACGICWKLYRTKEELAINRYVEPDLRASTAELEAE